MSGRRSVEWAAFPTPTTAVNRSVEWASFPSATAAPWATLELSAGNDFEDELREYAHVVSGQVDCGITSPASTTSLGDSPCDDVVMSTADADLGGDPQTPFTPPGLGVRPLPFSERLFQIPDSGVLGESRIHDVELSGEDDTEGHPAISENEVQAGPAGGERFLPTFVDPRVLIEDGGGDESLFVPESVLSGSVSSDVDPPSDNVSTDLVARDVVMMDREWDVTALRATFAQKFPPSTEFHVHGTTWTRDTVIHHCGINREFFKTVTT
jgi:hypothetical protein